MHRQACENESSGAMGPQQQAAAATVQAGVPLNVLEDLKDYAPGHDRHGYMVVVFPLDSVSPLAGVAAHQEPQSKSGHLQAPAATESLLPWSASSPQQGLVTCR